MTTEEQLEQVGDLGIELNASSRLTSSSIPPKDMDDSFESNLSQNNQNHISLNESKFSISEGGEQKSMYTTNEFKVILLGDSSVGKTSILSRYITDEFSSFYKCTINVEFKTKLIRIDKFTNVNLKIWDTVGSERFRSMTKQYYNNTDGIVLIFDLTDLSTFKNLSSWLEEIKNNSQPNVEIIIVGNKCDMENKRKIEYNEAMFFADKLGYQYIETSAKDGTNVLLVFEDLTRKMCKHAENNIENNEITNNISQSYLSKRLEFNKKKNKKEIKEKRKACC